MSLANNTVKPKIKIAFIDDEVSILNSVKRVLQREPYEIFTTSNAFDLYEYVQNEEVALVVSDQNMPHEKGNDVLNVIKHISPKTTAILLTGYADITSITKAINEGSIFKFLTKPWNETELKMTIKQGIEYHNIKKANERLLNLSKKQNQQLFSINRSLNDTVKNRTVEIQKLNTKLQKSFFETVKIIGALCEISSNQLSGHAKRVAKLSKEIAKEMGLNEKAQFQIQIAAFLHDIGKISNPNTSQQSDQKYNHAQVAYEIIKLVPELEEAALIVKHHHEIYDGSGFPSKLKMDEIPLGSRILSVADSYDKALNFSKGHELNTPKSLVGELESLAGFRYDPKVVFAFINYLKKSNLLHDIKKEKSVHLFELRPGMTLSKSLKFKNGKLLLNKGFELTEDIINRVWKKNLEEYIETEVFIVSRD